MPFAGIILAAGLSSRMGTPKQLLPLAGKPIVSYSSDAALAAELSPVIVIAGELAKDVEAMVSGQPVHVIHNPNYRTGMASSLTLGLHWLTQSPDAATISGALIMLGDQPFQSPELIGTLINTYQTHHSDGIRIVRPRFAGIPGHPVLFASSLFPELLQSEGDKGGRDTLVKHQSELYLVDFNEPHQGMDIDTPTDLETARQIAAEMKRQPRRQT